MNCLKRSVAPSHLPTYYAIKLHPHLSDEAAQYIHDVLQRDHSQGGGGLVVRRQQPTEVFPETVFHVSCSTELLAVLAEEMEMKKEDLDGHIRPVTAEEMNEFPESGRVGPLSISDIHRCVSFALERVHFPASCSSLPGHAEKKVMQGAPVISSYQEKGLLTIFPVHDKEDLDKLDIYWSKNTFSPPLDQIRNYFGESVALYWSFAQTYTRLLVIIAILGLAEYVLELCGVNYVYSNVIFALLNLLSLAVFCELWKRRSNEHSFYWGTSGKLRLKPPRPEYRGDWRENPVTGKREMYFSPARRIKTLLLVSVPATVLCLVLAFFLMILSFEADKRMGLYLQDPDTGELSSDLVSKVLVNLPSVLYSLTIIIFNKIYFKLGRKLTVLENHRTEEQHNLHITLKLIAFEFVNTFMALFYVGFWLGDLAGLRGQLVTTLITQQVVNQVQEVILPYFLHTPTSLKLQFKMSAKLGITEKPRSRQLRVTDIDSEEERVGQVNHDLLAEPLDTLHDDFMELWLQFGHVFLFAAIYPLAAAIALLNNITEFYADKYKLIRLARKPRPLAVRDIGGWYLAFRLTAIVSIASNCALIGLDLYPRASSQGWSDLQWWGMFVLIEKIFEMIFLAINSLISDTSHKVKVAMDRTDYHFKQKTVKAQ